jgi:hypothetical protein
MKKPIAKVTITCAVMSRNLEAKQADLARCDRGAVVAFGYQAAKFELAEIIQIALMFDGLQTDYEITLGLLPSDADANGGAPGGNNVN